MFCHVIRLSLGLRVEYYLFSAFFLYYCLGCEVVNGDEVPVW